MAEYIEREALVHHFMTTRQYLTKDLVMDAAYEVSKFPAADVASVVPELRKAVDLLHKEYEKTKHNPVVRDPLAYSLYQVWKAVDGQNGR